MNLSMYNYIAEQQTLAMRLHYVLDAVERLNSENIAEEAQRTLIVIAAEMAASLNDNLDSARLPKEEAAA
ncbi:hypothetical protein [Paracoccus alkanivorans]|uniref:Histidine kinase n=1 Tax=Paracoccus alkanivorans TaxID=2116655 RepID=A0A3M0MC48_9RHOB|nr:hypothetical protein [Paracoccus alkanivorans]RMC35348.1 hypothetical protein C9E81_08890 [Paracoccus alkanivorans]